MTPFAQIGDGLTYDTAQKQEETTPHNPWCGISVEAWEKNSPAKEDVPVNDGRNAKLDEEALEIAKIIAKRAYLGTSEDREVIAKYFDDARQYGDSKQLEDRVNKLLLENCRDAFKDPQAASFRIRYQHSSHDECVVLEVRKYGNKNYDPVDVVDYDFKVGKIMPVVMQKVTSVPSDR